MFNSALIHIPLGLHICVNELVLIGLHKDLSPVRRQAIICTNGAFLSIAPPGIDINEKLVEINLFSITKLPFKSKLSSVILHPFCPGEGGELAIEVPVPCIYWIGNHCARRASPGIVPNTSYICFYEVSLADGDFASLGWRNDII